jgi:hypothetical protein
MQFTIFTFVINSDRVQFFIIHLSIYQTGEFSMKDVALLIENLGQRYSDILGINLKEGDEKEIFKWFLTSVLFGAPINETSVIKTYKYDILDEGGYARYDFKTSTKLLEVMGNLIANYEGNLSLLHDQASSSSDLEKRLKELGKGIGDVTVSIFLRELRGLWEKADAKPTPLVILAAKKLGIIREENSEKALEELKSFWRKNKVAGKTFVNFETALLRFGKDLRRKEKHKK